MTMSWVPESNIIVHLHVAWKSMVAFNCREIHKQDYEFTARSFVKLVLGMAMPLSWTSICMLTFYSNSANMLMLQVIFYGVDFLFS